MKTSVYLFVFLQFAAVASATTTATTTSKLHIHLSASFIYIHLYIHLYTSFLSSNILISFLNSTFLYLSYNDLGLAGKKYKVDFGVECYAAPTPIPQGGAAVCGPTSSPTPAPVMICSTDKPTCKFCVH